MKREEAEEIWRLISAIYDLHPERSGEQATVWIPSLERMDAAIVMEIVDVWMRGKGPEKLPKLPEFSATVNAVIYRQRQDEQADRRASLGLEPGRPKPLWYVAWEKRWKAGDYRVFPEMEQAYLEDGEQWPPLFKGEPMEIIMGEEYDRLIAEAAQVEQTVAQHPKTPDPDCRLCEDDGVLTAGYTVVHNVRNGVVTHSRGADQVVPCPKCARGKALEFPLESTGPWGSEGFWRGRKHTVLGPGRVQVA